MIKRYIDKKARIKKGTSPVLLENEWKKYNIGTEEKPDYLWSPIIISAIQVKDHVNFQEIAELLGPHLVVESVNMYVKPVTRQATRKSINPGDYVVRFHSDYCDVLDSFTFESLFKEYKETK